MRKFLAIFSVLLSSSTFLAFQPVPAFAETPLPPVQQASCYTFTRNLTAGANGADVKALQQFLNSSGFPVSISGAGSKGSETTLFGTKTRIALAKFQANQNISPALGYFGMITRAQIALLCATAKTTGNNGTITVTVINTPPTTTIPSGPQLGTGTGNGIVVSAPAIIPPQTAPVVPPPAAPTISASAIDPRSVVGVLCDYNYNGQVQLMKGSGVIVNPEGYVLTARHLVDPRWTLNAYSETLSDSQKDMYSKADLIGCTIGLPSTNVSLPSPADILNYNPSTLITRAFQYNAYPYFVPSDAGFSSMEYQTADFAVLKITGATIECPQSGTACNEMGHFPYTPALTSGAPVAGSDQVLSYGYPAEAGVNNDGSSFYDFYLKGAVGTVGNYMSGDQRFSGQPLNFSFESSDIQNGRSGSPIFYKGRVTGVLYGSTSSQESYNLAMSAIAAMLHDAGKDNVLITN